jgi:hypothetical protein
MVAFLGLLLVAVVGASVVAIGGLVYYFRVLQPKLEQAAKPTPPAKRDPLAVVVEQLQELAVLRDKGILTTKEFSAKKSQLLEKL